MAKKKKKSVKSKIFGLFFIVLTIVLLTDSLKRIYSMYTLQKQAELVEEQLKLLQQENATLTDTKEKLEDPDYVQSYARGEYMFSKGDEKVFYLPSE